MRRHPLFLALIAIFFTLFLNLETFAQAVPTATGTRAYAIFHETDAQTAIEITWNSTVTISGAAGWTITIGGSNVVPTTSVSTGTGTSSKTTIILPTAIGVGQTVFVSWAGGSGANAFGPTQSVNQHKIICTDLTFVGYFDSSPTCAPVEPNSQMVFSVKPVARNSEFWTLTRTRLRVSWIEFDQAPYSYLQGEETDGSGNAAANTLFVSFHTDDYMSSISDPTTKYVYPANDPVCGYTSNWNIRLVYPASQGVSVNCPLTSAAQTQSYASHNNDDTGLGADVVMPATIENSDQVCIGSNVDMTFTDATDLNCNPTTAPIPTNNGKRWVRVVYGSTDLGGGNTATSNIPNIHVDGVQVTDANGNLLHTLPDGSPGYVPPTTPFGTPDAFGVVEVAAPVTNPRGILNEITTTSAVGQVIGQRFWVRLDYWNGCNEYDLIGDVSNLRRSVENEIEIITIPDPPVAVNQTVCKGVTPADFSVTGVPAGATTNWYRNSNGEPGTLIQSSATLPIADYAATTTDSLQTNVAGFYKVWASYTPNVVGAVTCETEKIPVTIIIRQQIPTPAEISGPTQVCADGTTVYSFSLAADSPTLTPTSPPTPATQLTTVGGPTQYNWSFTVPGNIDVTAPPAGVGPSGSTNKNFGAVFGTAIFGAGTSTNRTLQVNSTYTSGSTCTSGNETDAITVFRVSAGGTISQSPAGDICDESSKDFELTGHTGTIQEWQVSTDGGSTWSTDTDLGTLANPPAKTFSTPGAYQYRVIVKNGACATATSGTISFNVNVVPPKPTITANPDPATICADGSTVTLTSSNLGAVGTTFRWYKTTNLTTPVQNSASNQLVLSTVAASGDYVVDVRGPGTTFCTSPLSDPVTVLITALPEVTNVTGGGAACDGNPAPDIIFTFSGATTYNFTIDRPGALANIVETNYGSNTYTLSGQTQPGSYQIIALSNPATSCVGTVLGGTASVISAGGAPAFDEARVVTPNQTCNNGVSIADPSLAFSLTAVSASTGPFIFTYKINGSVSRTKNFNTDVDGSPTADLVFTDPELNATGTHTITIMSIQSPAGCLGLFNEDLSFTVNPLPTAPVSNGDIISCSDAISSASVSVIDLDGAGPITIDWYDVASGGSVLTGGSGTATFNPAVADEPVVGSFKDFYAVARNSSFTPQCESATRTVVRLTSDALPTAASVGVNQITCSDAATLTGNAADNGGTGAWTIDGPLFYETFSSVDNNVGATGGLSTTTPPSNNWSLDISNGVLVDGNDHIRVQGGKLVAQDTDNDIGAQYVDWLSSVINISAFPGGVDLSIDVSSTGAAGDDGIEFYYRINGGGLTMFNPALSVPITAQTITETGIIGNTLQIVIRIELAGNAQFISLDNVVVKPSTVAGLPLIADINDAASTVSALQDGVNEFTWTISSALGACTPSTAVLTVMKNPQPVTVDILQDLCETDFGTGSHLNYDLTVHNSAVSNSAADRTVSWYLDASLTMPVADETDVNISDNDIYYALVVNDITGCTNSTPVLNAGSVTFNINPLPNTNTHSSAFCENGQGSNEVDNINFTNFNDEVANGVVADRSVTWWLDPGTPVDEPSDLVLPIIPATSVDDINDEEVFFAVIENTATGCVNVDSLVFTINPLPLDNPIQTPDGSTPASYTVCASSSTLLFQVDPSLNAGSTYLWEVPTGAGEFVHVLGGGANDELILLRFPNIIGSPGLPLKVTETSANNCIGTTNTVMIIVDTSPPAPVITGDDNVCINEQNVSYSIDSPVGGSTYTWSVPGTLGSIVSGQGTDDVIVNISTTSGNITVVEENATGCVSPAATPFAVTVNNRPVMVSADDATICSGEAVNANLTFTADIPGSVFNWEVAFRSPGLTGATVGNTGVGDISHTLGNTTASVGQVIYDVTPKIDIDPGAGEEFCIGSPQTVTIDVDPEPVGQNDNAISCNEALSYNIQTQNINSLGNSIGSEFTYTVLSSDETNVPAAANERSTPSSLPITDTYINSTGADVTITYIITPISLITGCAGETFNYVVIIRSRPVGASYTHSPDICSGVALGIDPQDGITNGVISTFEWEADYATGLTGGATTGTGLINETLSNVGSSTLQVIYSVTPYFGTCAGLAFNITVNIDPQPVTNPDLGSTPICSDTPTGILLDTDGVSIGADSWDVDLVSFTGNLAPHAGNAADPGVSEATDYIQNDRFTNTSFAPGTVVYRVTPIGPPATFCRGVESIIELTVNPEPVMNPDLAPPPATDQIIVCSDEKLNVVLSTDGTSVAAQSYIFVSVSTFQAGNATPDPTETPIPANRAATVIQDDSYNNITGASITTTYQIKPKSAAGCFGDILSIPVEVLPEPDFTFNAPPPSCSDEAIELELNQTGATVIDHYQITSVNWDEVPVPGLEAGGSNIATNSSVMGPDYTILDTYTNATDQPLDARYKVIPFAVYSGKECAGDEKEGSVTIDPSPVVLEDLDEIVCNDENTGIRIDTKTESATAHSFEVIREVLPAGLSGGNYTPGTFYPTGSSTNLIAGDHVENALNVPSQIIYRVRANTNSDPLLGCYGPQETITVTVEPEIKAVITAASQNICSESNVKINIESPTTASQGDITYNFHVTGFGAPSGSNIIADGNPTPEIEQTLENHTNNHKVATYVIRPHANSAGGEHGCHGEETSIAITVEPKPKLKIQPASLTVCEGVPLAVDFSTQTDPSADATSSVFFKLDHVDLADGEITRVDAATSDIYPSGTDVLNESLTMNDSEVQQTAEYVFIPTFELASETCLGDQVTFNVTVSPRPVLLPFSIDPQCSAQSFGIDYAEFIDEAEVESTLATWTFSYPSGSSNITGASNGAGTELSQVVFNKNPDPVIVTYTFKAKTFNCEGNTITVPVEVYPLPKVTGVASSKNICHGGQLDVTLGSTANNTTYVWNVDDELQPDLTGATDQLTPMSNITNFTFTNTSESLSNYTFEITPVITDEDLPLQVLPTGASVNGCYGDPFTLVANIAPPIDGTILTSNGSNENFICEGSSEFLFMEFKGLPLFEVVFSDGTNTETFTRQGSFKPIQVTPTATTTYELISVTDAYGCFANINKTATVNVNNTDASFSVLGPVESCSPYKVSFQYDQQEGVNYTWKWFDGPDSTTYTADATIPEMIVKHTFENPSPVGTSKYKVYLETSLADSRYPGCTKTSFQQVLVSANPSVGIFPNATEICSGETVSVVNSSQGVTTHRWFYREQGTLQELEVKNTSTVAYELVNNTSANPITYEIVYQADNGKCPSETSVPVKVYKGVTASFNANVPPFVAGNATVNFTNTSSPIDEDFFDYAWDFDLIADVSSDPSSHEGGDIQIDVDYKQPGFYEVMLKATNRQALSDGVECSSTSTQVIHIEVPPLVSAFTVTPLASCYPTTLVVDNQSPGDTFLWKLVSGKGEVATSNVAQPVFEINEPGTYRISLKASLSSTGQEAPTVEVTGIEIYGKPSAFFIAPNESIFVPDTELGLINQSVDANFYEWNFGDGTISNDFEPEHFYQLEGKYQLILVAGNDHGEKDIDGDGIMDGNVVCYDTLTTMITAREGGFTRIPNAFTPNTNGPVDGGSGNAFEQNDVFLPVTKGVVEFNMQVYDRWGTLVFESNDKNVGWNGYDRDNNLLPAGVYVYKLTLRLADGQRTTQVGDITMIR